MRRLVRRRRLQCARGSAARLAQVSRSARRRANGPGVGLCLLRDGGAGGHVAVSVQVPRAGRRRRVGRDERDDDNGVDHGRARQVRRHRGRAGRCAPDGQEAGVRRARARLGRRQRRRRRLRDTAQADKPSRQRHAGLDVLLRLQRGLGAVALGQDGQHIGPARGTAEGRHPERGRALRRGACAVRRRREPARRGRDRLADRRRAGVRGPARDVPPGAHRLEHRRAPGRLLARHRAPRAQRQAPPPPRGRRSVGVPRVERRRVRDPARRAAELLSRSRRLPVRIEQRLRERRRMATTRTRTTAARRGASRGTSSAAAWRR